MSCASEYQISQAGGDGDDPLDPIRARLATDRDDFADGYADQSIRDREHLLETIRVQAATLAAVLTLANSAGRAGWHVSPTAIRETLRGES